MTVQLRCYCDCIPSMHAVFIFPPFFNQQPKMAGCKKQKKQAFTKKGKQQAFQKFPLNDKWCKEVWNTVSVYST